MHVHDVILSDQFLYEFLPLFCGEIGGDDGHLWAVTVFLPIDADCFQTGIAQRCCQTSVAAADLYCPGSLSLGLDGDLNSDERIVLVRG